MRNDVQKPLRGDGRGNNGLFSVRSLSNYMRIMSSGASTAASTLRSAGASIVSSITNHEDDGCFDQVHWAGFDKLESEGDVLRQIMLLSYRSGFQVWDVEKADDVRQLVSRHDGLVSFMQMQKNPIVSKRFEDRFADVRPLLIVVCDGSFNGSGNSYDIFGSPCNGTIGNCQDPSSENLFPTFVRFYSLRTHEYVHDLKFRSAVYSVRCSPRVVAVSQASQIHCFDAATLEREYTILTNPIVAPISGSGSIGYGPLAVGTRWLAYSGSPVEISNTGRVSPQILSPFTGLPLSASNGSLVAHYAKESSKQLAAGIVTLGDIGYKKLSKYCSEFRPNNNGSTKLGNSGLNTVGAINGYAQDSENVGMVIVRDVVSKSVVVQFRAHTSPISALCFDPSGTLLVTASIHGRNINVFRIMPSTQGNSSGSDANGAYIHLYRLQRGITNAVIKDISFSSDSQWIMISSSRGTSHLFTISPYGGIANFQCSENGFTNNNFLVDLTAKSSNHFAQTPSSSKINEKSSFASSSPVTLSVVSRIRNGNNGLKGAVRGAAALATGVVSPISGAIASAFHNCGGDHLHSDDISLWPKYYLLVFSPSGSIINYVLHRSLIHGSGIDISGLGALSHVSSKETDTRFVVEALQKWDLCHKRNRRDHDNSVDIYGDHGYGERTKIVQKVTRNGTSIYPSDRCTDTKVKLSAEENHHLYISEIELQMHAMQVPLWSKSGICFQVMANETAKGENFSTICGEVEIERIPSRMVEAKSKNLIPVFDYIQTSRFQQASVNTFNINRHGPLLQEKSGLSEDDRLSCRSTCSSLDYTSESAALSDPFDGGNENGLAQFPNVDAVNSCTGNLNIKSHLELVNSSKDPEMEAQLGCVNNKENMMETHFEACDNGID
ncbi:autophagy-related protein 18f-like isoform X1 [Typha angustifolia]|uniref:autophagy-related protein 18f-like isoform X1 n=1 Tax=Typha angustifolia TaxID=59011 RepID=UPI003C2FDBFF